MGLQGGNLHELSGFLDDFFRVEDLVPDAEVGDPVG